MDTLWEGSMPAYRKITREAADVMTVGETSGCVQAELIKKSHEIHVMLYFAIAEVLEQ
jgi:hypothetical protein